MPVQPLLLAKIYTLYAGNIFKMAHHQLPLVCHIKQRNNRKDLPLQKAYPVPGSINHYFYFHPAARKLIVNRINTSKIIRGQTITAFKKTSLSRLPE